mmetsp:Transcript_85547/g.242611  ORF Transcript_85547/g.242611 Transcript_85547/m.242611 type:complete len:413 (-) Transcript_85547:76-1314(-)|eukprot:CAMPEP_0179230636 /NCGR_PEP_ID=MMETSP0797-20121207/10934_1 /TAXON_ID=47934 /ORGANISM="Dinophysis acuminata, Strain DAEP01" /LENGTH=412 /DNA_ID=CAMNT_0020937707 /DNA_START=45 /DNA_END=1283 /DNA_ORIENTATION=+
MTWAAHYDSHHEGGEAELDQGAEDPDGYGEAGVFADEDDGNGGVEDFDRNEEELAAPPPRKRARVDGAEDGGGEATAAVRLTGVPAEYTHATLKEMHEAFDLGALQASDFGPWARTQDGSKACAVTLRYTSEEAAAAAAQVLDGQPVATRAGEALYLHAKVVPLPRQSSGSGGGGRRQPEAAGGGRHSGHSDRSNGRDAGRQPQHAPQRAVSVSVARSQAGANNRGPGYIYPSVYVSDVPVEWDEVAVKELHIQCNIDPAKVMAVKFLPTQDAGQETCSCIVRYEDQECADQAIQAIRGRGVQLASGAAKFLGAREAKPARWMVDQQNKGDGATRRVAAAPPPSRSNSHNAAGGGPPRILPAPRDDFDWCGQGPNCIGTIGMLLFEDISSGAAYCEACWEKWTQDEQDRSYL